GSYVRDLDHGINHRIPEPIFIFGSNAGVSDVFFRQDGRAIEFLWWDFGELALHNIDVDASRLLPHSRFGHQLTDTAREALIVTAFPLVPAVTNGSNDVYVI